jgi:hypothetical protein
MECSGCLQEVEIIKYSKNLPIYIKIYLQVVIDKHHITNLCEHCFNDSLYFR